MKRTNVKTITYSAIIASLYVVLTFISNAMGLANGAIQIRLSEVLTVLPYFTPYAIPGLFVGCMLSNILIGSVIWDVIFGSLATLIGAVGTYSLRKHKWLAPISPIISNTFIIPLVLSFAYDVSEVLPYLMLTVGIGEIISAGILGMVLLTSISKHKNIF